MTSPDHVDAASLFHRWSKLAILPRFSWIPTKSFARAALAFSNSQKDELHRLLDRSESALSPLPDPLRANLGLHRWLLAEREEAYSDWLAWILEELKQPQTVLELLGVVDSECIGIVRGCELTVKREHAIDVDQKQFRLDIFITFSSGGSPKASLVVEVKKSSAEDADIAKQECYLRWHQSASVPSPLIQARS